MSKPVTPTDSTYSSLLYAFDYFNQALFDALLPPVVFTYHRQTRVMGYASFERWVDINGKLVDELAINPEYFAKYPLIEICQTLVHEMVHIWQTHHGSPSRRNYHNMQWAKKMQSVGLMPSSTGLPEGKVTGEAMMDYVMLNGAFLTACRALKGQGFHIPLVDRFPVFRLERPILAYDENGHGYELTNAYNIQQSEKLQEPVHKTAPKNQNAAFENSRFIVTENAQQQAVSASFLTPATSKPKPKAGRVKYRCRSCQTLVWAKPGINIACIDCETKFSQME
jgi:predicted SprT family Zn-dependent metalloprotease